MNNIYNLKIGCGKYIQGKNIKNIIPKVIKDFSDKVLVIGGPITINLLFPALGNEFNAKDIEYKLINYEGKCTRNQAIGYSEIAISKGFGAIIGVGGGKCMDLAKAVAFFSKLPVINIPTSIATCAAVSAVSIMYTNEGKCDGNILMDRETDAVIVDSDIIARSPKRLIASGIFDSLAKLPEVLNGEEKMDINNHTLLSYIAYANSKIISEFLLYHGKNVSNNPEFFDKLEDLILINLLYTSLVSGFSCGLNQLALAHGLYDAARNLFTEDTRDILHGEIVGTGILIQMAYNGNSQKEINNFKNFMIEMNIPTKLKELNINPNRKNISLIQKYLQKSCNIKNSGIKRLIKSVEQIL